MSVVRTADKSNVGTNGRSPLQTELPEGWEWKTLGEVADINPRIDKSKIADDLQVTFVPMPAVGAGDGQIDVSQLRPAGEVKKGYTPFEEGDVLFAKITPCMENGKMAVVPKLHNGVGFGSTEFHVLRPRHDVAARYLYHFVSNASFRRDAAHSMTGAVGQKRVPTAYLSDCHIPLAPLPQQKLIVAEIEKQFSRLDEAVTELKRVKANLERYKAAVLKAAVEGKLTAQWRLKQKEEGRKIETGEQLLKRILAERKKKWEEKNPGKKYKEPVAPDTSNLPELPKGWVWATMPQLGELNRGKSKHRPRNDPKLYGGQYPFIQTGDVRHANGVITEYIQTYSEEGLKQSRLWPKGTLCITIAANIADTAILGFESCFPDIIVGFISASKDVEARFIEYFIRTAKKNVERFAPATAQKNINLEILDSVAVPLPPAGEQQLIIDEIESRFSVAEEIEATDETNLKRAERLRQSILKKAFSGMLLVEKINKVGSEKKGELYG